MANELQFAYGSAANLYAVLISQNGQFVNGAALEDYNAAHWTNYAKTLTRTGTSWLYFADMPALAADEYTFYVYIRAGAAPAVSDFVFQIINRIAWDGSAVVSPSADYTTAATVKVYLGIGTASDDTLLGTLCTAAQAIIDAYTGRTFAASNDSTLYADAVADVDGLTLRLPGDVCAITSITNGDGTTITAGQYVTEPRGRTPYYAVKLLASSGLTWTYTDDPENAITIVGKAAYSATAPYDIQQAATRLAAYLYRQKDAQVFDVTAQPDMGIITVPQGIPRDVLRLLAPYRKQI
jgi:uncharacterized phiE125 gp8 family phage protein